MKNKISCSLLILLFAITNCHSQNLYKWSKNCGRLVESHELYLWLKQSQQEIEKKQDKIYKQINKQYNSSIEEINSLIENEKIAIEDKNSYLIRSIYYLNLSNELLESIDKEILENKTESFDKIYNDAFEAQKEYATNIILQPKYYNKTKEYKAINLFGDLYATDTTNIDIKNSYSSLLKTVSENNIKIIDSLKKSLEKKDGNLDSLLGDLSFLVFFDEEMLKDRLRGYVLTHPKFPNDFFMISKGTMQGVGCKFESMKELLFFNQKVTENNFKVYFQPNIDKAKKIVSDYMESIETNQITAFDLANHIVKNKGVLGQEMKDKLYNKDDKLYYLDNSVFYEITEKNNMISFQYDKLYNENGRMGGHVREQFSMQSHGSTHNATYKLITKPTTYHEVFVFKRNRTLDNLKKPQDLIFLTRRDIPTTDSYGAPSSKIGVNYNFHYVKVKSANKEAISKVLPLLEYSDTSVDYISKVKGYIENKSN